MHSLAHLFCESSLSLCHKLNKPGILRFVILTLISVVFIETTIKVCHAEDPATSSGTGFIVSRQGHVLTNHHVIEGCASVRTNTDSGLKELILVGSDVRNDLAVLRLPGSGFKVARFREGRPIRSGDSVVVVGYPLHKLLASEANVTTGAVSALAGIANDKRYLQMTAPVQPGNSGGPLLDHSGLVVGVVVAKLDAITMAKVTGDIPQNVNFSINVAVTKLFLDSYRIRYDNGVPGKKLDAAEIGEQAKAFTLLLECYPEKMGAERARLEAQRQALEAERLALENQRRAFEEERRALAEASRKDVEKHSPESKLPAVIYLEEPDYEIVDAEPNPEERPELIARFDAEAASERVLRFHEEERALEAVELPSHHPPVPQYIEDFSIKESAIQEVREGGPPRASESNPFWAKIEALISRLWFVEDGRPGTYTAVVGFRLSRDGQVANVQIVRSSGNKYFDIAAKDAVVRARTLPSFPDEMTAAYYDVEMRFPIANTRTR